MAEVETNTHGSVVAGAGSAAAGPTTIGQITLPAGGPWMIFGAWAQVVAATHTPAEAVGGHFRFDPASGDLTPDPSPSRMPTFGDSSGLNTTGGRIQSALNIFPVAWEGAGKAVINCIYEQAITITVAPQVVMGLLYGKTIPERLPAPFYDLARGTITATADTAVGTITLAEKATRITGVCGILQQDGVVVAGEELTGFWRLASDDVQMPPMQLPFNTVFGAGLGATIPGNGQSMINFIPVDIPIIGGSRINSFVDLNTAVTNAADVEIFLAYE